jgi:hypothetical protein
MRAWHAAFLGMVVLGSIGAGADAAAGACGSDSDCKGDRVCRKGQCAEPEEGNDNKSCKRDSDCPGDRVCEDESCTPPRSQPKKKRSHAARDDSSRQRVAVRFRAGADDEKYDIVSLDTGERCTTPCTLGLVPGTARIGVHGDSEFDDEIEVPSSGAAYEVRSRGGGLVALGVTLGVAGMLLAVGGIITVYDAKCTDPSCPDSSSKKQAGTALLGVGAIAAVGGIVSLALSGRRGLYTYSEQETSRVRLPHLGVVPAYHGAAMVGVWQF